MLVVAKFWQHLNCGLFLHTKTSGKKMLEGLRLFLLQYYLHFKWCIMVFTFYNFPSLWKISNSFCAYFCLTWFSLKSSNWCISLHSRKPCWHKPGVVSCSTQFITLSSFLLLDMVRLFNLVFLRGFKENQERQ